MQVKSYFKGIIAPAVIPIFGYQSRIVEQESTKCVYHIVDYPSCKLLGI